MTFIFSEHPAKEVLNNNYVLILFYEEESLLLIKWKRQISFQERKDGFMWAYRFSCSHGVRNWLLDDNEIFLITSAEKEWVTYTWTKLVARSGIKKIAVVIPGHITSLTTNVQFTEEAQRQYEASGPTRHEVFTDYHLALAWFKEEL
jgi:hypothetical protein